MLGVPPSRPPPTSFPALPWTFSACFCLRTYTLVILSTWTLHSQMFALLAFSCHFGLSWMSSPQTFLTTQAKELPLSVISSLFVCFILFWSCQNTTYCLMFSCLRTYMFIICLPSLESSIMRVQALPYMFMTENQTPTAQRRPREIFTLDKLAMMITWGVCMETLGQSTAKSSCLHFSVVVWTCVKTSPEPSGLKPQPFYSSTQFCGAGNWARLAGKSFCFT